MAGSNVPFMSEKRIPGSIFKSTHSMIFLAAYRIPLSEILTRTPGGGPTTGRRKETVGQLSNITTANNFMLLGRTIFVEAGDQQQAEANEMCVPICALQPGKE